MRKGLTKFGNSYGIIIDKPILDLLRISTDTPLEITTDGTRLVLTPVRAAEEEAAYGERAVGAAEAIEIAKGVMDRHAKTLGKLAK
jgi:antitoxin component of MazEF toxin-antitoxin module